MVISDSDPTPPVSARSERSLAYPSHDQRLHSTASYRLSPLDRLAKRFFDLCVAIALLVLFAPLMLLLALLIKLDKLDGTGPVLFGQQRIGRDRRPFTIYKFRTMTARDATGLFRQTCGDDARITRIGRLLRRSSLDALPQLFNVIRGEMSIVGPRPHASVHDDECRRVVAHYDLRYHMRPGITGLAQVRDLRDPTETPCAIENRIAADLQYVEGWSLLLDCKIVALTTMLIWIDRQAC